MSDSTCITGAQCLVASLVDLGIEYVFTNPGTTELELVQAMETNQDLTPVLVTQELVATAAADGFARFHGLGAALLHLGPGFSNGAAFVHDAKRAGTPMLVIVGEHPDTHLAVDAALNTDLAAIMAPFCVEVLVVDDPASVAQTSRRAGELARLHRGPVGLIAPQNVMSADVGRDELDQSEHDRDESSSNESGREESVQTVAVASSRVVGANVAQPSRLLDHAVQTETSSTAEASGPTKDEVGDDPLLLLGSTALGGASQLLAARIASHIGARLYAEVFPAVMERGSHLPPISRIPYFPDQARTMIGTPSMVILIGASEPLSYFAQQEMAPQLIPAETKIVTLVAPGGPAESGLRRWAKRLGVDADLDDGGPDSGAVEGTLSAHIASEETYPEKTIPTASNDDPLTVESVGRLFAHYQLSGDVVVDEGRTSSGPAVVHGMSAPPHWYVGHPGGAIGGGLGLALGAAVATRRRVRALIADGGSLYAPQALWTIAHLGLDVGVVVVANQGYRILRMEMKSRGIEPISRDLTQIEHPCVDFIALAKAFGVAGYRANTVGELASILEAGGEQHRPFLVVAELADPS